MVSGPCRESNPRPSSQIPPCATAMEGVMYLKIEIIPKDQKQNTKLMVTLLRVTRCFETSHAICYPIHSSKEFLLLRYVLKFKIDYRAPVSREFVFEASLESGASETKDTEYTGETETKFSSCTKTS